MVFHGGGEYITGKDEHNRPQKCANGSVFINLDCVLLRAASSKVRFPHLTAFNNIPYNLTHSINNRKPKTENENTDGHRQTCLRRFLQYLHYRWRSIGDSLSELLNLIRLWEHSSELSCPSSLIAHSRLTYAYACSYVYECMWMYIKGARIASSSGKHYFTFFFLFLSLKSNLEELSIIYTLINN